MEQLDPAPASSEALEMEGLAWFNQLLSGAVTHDQAQAFKSWRAQSPEHEAAFARIVQLRRAAKDAIEMERRPPAAPRRGTGRAASAQRRSPDLGRRAFIGGAIAASGAGLMVARPFERAWTSWSEYTSDFHTSTGERRDLSLGRGVALELNTRTSVSRRIIDGSPAVALIAGEAAVTADRPPAAPFVVAAGAGQTRIASGAADIRVEGGSVCVTCLHGGVEVTHPRGRLTLTAGAAATYTAHGLASASLVDPQLVAAWRRGLLIFRNAPLQQVVDQLNRYRPGRIILTDAALARRPVYGVFQIRQIAQAVPQVQALTGAKAVSLPGGIVLLS